jgi:hypothetical protein
MGIEPTYSAWKAAALPLSYTRISREIRARRLVGFAEPVKSHRMGGSVAESPRSGSVVKNDAGRMAQPCANFAHPVTKVDAIRPARPLNGTVMHGKGNRVALP